MIPRYDCPEISSLWSDAHKYALFVRVEMALMRAQEEKGLVPPGTHKAFDSVVLNPQRIAEIEAEIRHDIVAFTTHVSDQVEPKYSKWLHFGITSSDVLDTTLMLQIKESLLHVRSRARELVKALQDKSLETDDLYTIGRTHGMYAEPMYFSAKFASAELEIQRALDDYEDTFVGQFSGAVGNYTISPPEVEQRACEILGLTPEVFSTQVIPRDRIAREVMVGARLAKAIERLCVEIRHLQRSEVGEVEEAFSAKQKGSSTMPHKRNPIASENLTGMARVVASHVSIALDNIPLWHERDISHSCTERLYLPDHFGILYYMCRRATILVSTLVIKRDVITKRLEEARQDSSFLLHKAIRESAPDETREDIYRKVQEQAFNGKLDKVPLEEYFQ